MPKKSKETYKRRHAIWIWLADDVDIAKLIKKTGIPTIFHTDESVEYGDDKDAQLTLLSTNTASIILTHNKLDKITSVEPLAKIAWESYDGWCNYMSGENEMHHLYADTDDYDDLLALITNVLGYTLVTTTISKDLWQILKREINHDN